MMTFFTGVYYFLLLIVVFVCELNVLYNATKTIEIEKAIVADDNATEEVVAKNSAFILWQFLYFLLGIIGLFSSQWPIFVVMMILGMIPRTVMGKVILKIDAVLCLALTIFLVINVYHLHIDINPF